MRIHTKLSKRDISAAVRKARVNLIRFDVYVSRSHDWAFEVVLSGSGAHRSRCQGNRDYPAATWDEWGIFLGEIFRRDPTAKTRAYRDADDFLWKTGERFDDITPDRQHKLHRWDRYPVYPSPGQPRREHDPRRAGD